MWAQLRSYTVHFFSHWLQYNKKIIVILKFSDMANITQHLMTLISFFNGKQTFFHINPVEINQTEVINCCFWTVTYQNVRFSECNFLSFWYLTFLDHLHMIYPSENQLVKSSSALNTVNLIMLDFRHTKKRTWWKNLSCLKIWWSKWLMNSNKLDKAIANLI